MPSPLDPCQDPNKTASKAEQHTFRAQYELKRRGC
jgi:hypothetical protein